MRKKLLAESYKGIWPQYAKRIQRKKVRAQERQAAKKQTSRPDES